MEPIRMPDDGDHGLDDIPVVIMMRKAAEEAVGHPGGFGSRAEVAHHLARWLRRPGNIVTALAMPIAGLTGDDEDGGAVADIMIDRALSDILRTMDVDPQAFCVIAAIHSIGTMTLDDIRFTFDAGRNDRTGVWHVSAIVDIDGVTDIHTGARRIETGHDIPETVMAMMPGRPLRDVLSHPLLDAADLVIDEAHAIGAGTRIYHRERGDLRIGDIGAHESTHMPRKCA